MAAENKILSIRPREQIEVRGFESIDPNLHMVEWLGRGKEVRQFVVGDVESELYAQDRDAQVISVECIGEPEYETKIKRQDSGSRGILSQFALTLPLRIRVRAGGGSTWVLVVRHNYSAVDLDVPGQRKLTLNFQIVGQPEIEV